MPTQILFHVETYLNSIRMVFHNMQKFKKGVAAR